MSKRRIEYVEVGSVEPYESNPKDHDLDELRASFGRWGYTQPILLCERAQKLAAGHGRQELLLFLSKLDERPDDWPEHQSWPPDGITVRRDGVWMQPIIRGWSSRDDDELRAYVIADNALVPRGGWVNELLAEQLKLVEQSTMGLSGVGYTGDDLEALLKSLTPPPDPDTDPQLGDGMSYSVIVQCRDEAHQRELLERFAHEQLDVRALMT